MSISGWYHASTPPPGAQHASLQQLTAVRAAAAKLQAQAAQETGETKGQEGGGLDAEGLRAGEDALCSHTPYEGERVMCQDFTMCVRLGVHVNIDACSCIMQTCMHMPMNISV